MLPRGNPDRLFLLPVALCSRLLRPLFPFPESTIDTARPAKTLNHVEVWGLSDGTGWGRQDYVL